LFSVSCATNPPRSAIVRHLSFQNLSKRPDANELPVRRNRCHVRAEPPRGSPRLTIICSPPGPWPIPAENRFSPLRRIWKSPAITKARPRAFNVVSAPHQNGLPRFRAAAPRRGFARRARSRLVFRARASDARADAEISQNRSRRARLARPKARERRLQHLEAGAQDRRHRAQRKGAPARSIGSQAADVDFRVFQVYLRDSRLSNPHGSPGSEPPSIS
jgi:hypothetical protein